MARREPTSTEQKSEDHDISLFTYEHDGGYFYLYENNSEDQVLTEQVIF